MSILKIPKRDKNVVVEAKPTNLTLEQAFAIVFKQYEQTLKELSKR